MVAVLVAVVLLGGTWATLQYGATRWHAESNTLRARMLALQPDRRSDYDAAEILDLPGPVRHYFATVLQPGVPHARSAHLTTEGRFLLDVDTSEWAPFAAEQLVTTGPPAFDWSARMPLFPGVDVLVRDSYIEGAGSLHAALGGLVTLAAGRSPALAEGELLRYLAEAVWVPTALLPDHGVRWTALDGRRALATLTDGATTASLEFRFGANGLVTEIYSPARPRQVGDSIRLTPWLGRWSLYDPRHGMLVPTTGEAAWLLPEGALSYWKGRLVEVSYD
jgi:hypothetical protein